jgi:hypothetical protein
LLPGIAPARTIRQHGYTLSFNGSSHYLVSSRTIKPAAQFSVFAWVRPAAVNASYTRIIETDYTSGFYLGSNTASRYCWIVNNASLEGCIGGQQVAGQRDFVCGVFDGSNRILYINGIQAASSAATAPSALLPVYISRWNNTSGYYWNGDIDTVAIFNRALGPSEIWSLYQNPWQLFKAPARRLWRASATNNLAGEGSVQGNAGATAEIVQVQALAVIPAFQFNAIAVAAVTQSHALATSDAAIQSNSSVEAVVTQSHALAISDAETQSNSSAEAAIRQDHALGANGIMQPGTASAVPIVVALPLSIAPCSQTNATSIGEITQAHTLEIISTQTQLSSPAAIPITQAQRLAGANAAQENISPSAEIIRGTGNLAAAALLQTNICGPAVVALVGAIPDVFRNPIAVSAAVKKPGIPRGTPEWLKTFLEIISGRRGNRILIPPLEILTFSATPTKAECEALYSYVNKVRASVADLINRLDG